MPKALQVSPHRTDDTVTYSVSGAFTVVGLPSFAEMIDSLDSTGLSMVGLDLAEVTMVDSRVIGALVGWHKHFLGDGVDFRLVAVSETVARILAVSSLDHFFHLGPPDEKSKTEPVVSRRLLFGSRDYLEQVLAALGEAVFCIGENGRIVSANPAAESLLGCRETDLIGQPIDTLIVTPRVPQSPVSTRLLSLRNHPLNEEGRLIRRQGGELPVFLNGTSIRRGEEVVGAVLGVVDMMRRKQLEASLREKEAQIRGMFEAIPDLIFLQDREGNFLSLHAPSPDTLAFPPEQVLGRNIRELDMPETVVHENLALIATALRTREVQVHEYSLEVPAGRRQYEARIAPCGDDLTISIVRDVTVSKNLEAQLFQSQKMEAVGQLAGGVAHDFNNALFAIQGNTELALEALPSDQPARADLQEVLSSVRWANQLTTQLLAFSRKQELEKQVLDVDVVLNEISKMLGRLIGEHIHLEIETSPQSKPASIDRSQIEQVFLNLCINARDAMPDGGRVRIATKGLLIDEEFCHANPWASPGEYVAVTVDDTGRGMDEFTLSRIFEPFFTTKTPDRGTGLGLATAYGIVRQHGGMLVAESQVGRGSTFCMYLPLADREPASSEAIEAQLPSLEELPGGTKTILVAEDDAAVRSLVVRLLRQVGYQVLTAVDGPTAMEVFLAHEHEVDLLLLDVMMPVIGGISVYERIQRICTDVPVVFASGYSAEAVPAGYFEKMGYPLLRKPYSTEVLLRTIRALLDSASDHELAE